jgi:CRISPR-associated protein Csb2
MTTALTLKITLTHQTFGGTSSGQNQLEANAEIIPSPYRLLRAALNGGFLAGNSDAVIAAVRKLTNAPAPSYYIPPFSYAQTRTMKRDDIEQDVSNYHKVYADIGAEMLREPKRLQKMGRQLNDAFIVFDPSDSAIYTQWDFSGTGFDLADAIALQLAISKLGYLGRSEYPAIWEIVSEEDMPAANAFHDELGLHSVLGVIPGDVDHLLISPSQYRSENRIATIPGAKALNYTLKKSLDSYPVAATDTIDNCVVWSISGKYDIPANRTAVITGAIHKTLIAKITKTQGNSPTFSGKDDDGNIIRTNNHAYITPILDYSRFFHGQITHLVISARTPFSETELDAIFATTRIYSRDFDANLSVEAVGRFQQMFKPVSGNIYFKTPVWQSFCTATRKNGKVRMVPGSELFAKGGSEFQALRALTIHPDIRPLVDDYDSIKILPNDTEQQLKLWADDKLMASCGLAYAWPNAHLWATQRGSRQASGLGQEISIKLADGFSIVQPSGLGFGAHYGLGAIQMDII